MHPQVDNIYISVTCLHVIVSLYAALGFSKKTFNYADYTERIRSALDRGRQQPEALGLRLPGFEGLGLALLVQQIRPTFVEDPNGIQSTVLLIALQFPVHTYSVFALRAANESHLVQGNTEQDWGFGQVVAVILLGSNVLMLVDGILEYRRWRKPQVQVP